MTSEPATLFKRGTATEVQELMTKGPVSVRKNETVRDALDRIVEERVSAVTVLDAEGGLVGIVSIADLVRTVLATDEILQSDYPHYDDCLWAVDLIQQRLGTDAVTSVMSEVLATVGPDESMHHAACIMLNNGVHHLPVVDGNGRLAGILSSKDFVRLTAGIR